MSTSIPEQPTTQPPAGSAHKPKPRSKTRATKARHQANSAKHAKTPRPAGPGPRPASKTGKVLHLLLRTGGATLSDLMKATHWQAHSLRGFLSLRKKMGLAITSTAGEDGARRYALKA